MEDKSEHAGKQIEANALRKQQGKIRHKYDYLKDVTSKYFQAEYVKAQAEEICRYIKEVELTPLNPWYSALHNMASDGKFMNQFYLTFNEFGVIEPNYTKINTLIKEPAPEDFPK